MIVLLVLAGIGAVTLAFIILDSLWSSLELISSYLMPYFQPGEVQSLTARFGSWAAVTGSTDGIGKQYALELARRGLNVVLISRSEQKLRDVAALIESKYRVKTKAIVADFTEGPGLYPRIEAELRDLPLGILVNNVGCQTDYPASLCEHSPKKIWELIQVNCVACTLLTRHLLPEMVARGKGAIVNVSSGSELQPLPLMAVYAATKAYVRSFTVAIRHEYSAKGIYVQHLAPLFVSTKMNAFSRRITKGNMLVPDAETYAKHAVETLGRVQDTTGYWIHGIQADRLNDVEVDVLQRQLVGSKEDNKTNSPQKNTNYLLTKIPPVWIRTKIGGALNEQFRQEYIENIKNKHQ